MCYFDCCSCITNYRFICKKNECEHELELLKDNQYYQCFHCDEIFYNTDGHITLEYLSNHLQECTLFLEADDYENPLTLSDKGILGYFDEVHCNEKNNML